MECFDVVDMEGNPTGQVVERTKAHAEGIRHRTAHVWIVRRKCGKWQVLLQKRAQGKDSFPGCYDTSSAGHVQAGDEPKESALRELKEELGITAKVSDLVYADWFDIHYETVFYGKTFRDNEAAFVYILERDIDPSDLILQKEEVEAAEWFDLEAVKKALCPRNPLFCIPSGGFEIVEKWCSGIGSGS